MIFAKTGSNASDLISETLQQFVCETFLVKQNCRGDWKELSPCICFELLLTVLCKGASLNIEYHKN